MRYQSKPSEIEAVQWTGENVNEILAFTGNDKIRFCYEDGLWTGEIELLAGKDGAQDYVPLPVDHWVVHPADDLTDWWPVDPDYFELKYRPA